MKVKTCTTHDTLGDTHIEQLCSKVVELKKENLQLKAAVQYLLTPIDLNKLVSN